jgi:hypothetical protein
LQKILFALEIEDEWPPVSTEGVWCEAKGNGYRLVNAPFFIKGLAYGDVFEATIDPVNEHVFEFKVIEESGHSLVWVLNNSNLDITSFKNSLLALGCNIEGFEQFRMYSIDVPPSVDTNEINELIDTTEQEGFAFAFPVWRHDDART